MLCATFTKYTCEVQLKKMLIQKKHFLTKSISFSFCHISLVLLIDSKVAQVVLTFTVNTNTDVNVLICLLTIEHILT